MMRPRNTSGVANHNWYFLDLVVQGPHERDLTKVAEGHKAISSEREFDKL